ncbi:MAG: LuxR C-terminal-related transcriptional regulator [Gemmatimonadota bacterium]
MGRTVLLFGVVAGVLIAVLRLIEYRWLVVAHSVEIYGALVGALFAGVGIWIGLKLTRPRETLVVREVPVPAPDTFVRNEAQVEALGLTPRELEMLELAAEGLSTKEIAARSHVSANTVKTHLGNLFTKLGARRRTQAVQRGRELGLIP